MSPRLVHLPRALLAAAFFAVFGAFVTLRGVPCPVAMTVGVPCPACGSTRSLRALLHLDVEHAFRIHPAAPLVIVLLGLLVVRVLYLVARDGHALHVGDGRFGRPLLRALLAATLLEIGVWSLRWFGLFGGPVPV